MLNFELVIVRSETKQRRDQAQSRPARVIRPLLDLRKLARRALRISLSLLMTPSTALVRSTRQLVLLWAGRTRLRPLFFEPGQSEALLLAKLGQSAASPLAKLGQSAASPLAKLGQSAASPATLLYLAYRFRFDRRAHFLIEHTQGAVRRIGGGLFYSRYRQPLISSAMRGGVSWPASQGDCGGSR